MKIILIGVQGSGKSTQGIILSESLNVPYLSTGHIFREIAKEKTPFGRYIKETSNAGFLIPDDKTLDIVSDYLKRDEYNKGYIMDGFPRTVKQAENFDESIDTVVYLNVSDKEALWRLSYRKDEQREDETLIALRKRIELFHKFTEPVLGYYRDKKLLYEIRGDAPIEKIHKEIMSHISKTPK